MYAGWDVIQERNGSNQLLRSFLLSGQSTDGVVAFTNYNATTGAETGSYFYLKDARGNVVALADTSANVVERYVYDPFGVPTRYDASWSPMSTLTGVDNPYYFQSRRYDGESGLYHYRMRYLDPVVGRFISPDPIGAWGDPMNVGNPYSFVGNNPWTYGDPFGLNAGDPFSPEWHHVFPTEIFGDIFGDLDEAFNGFWLPNILHNTAGTGVHNNIDDFGLHWNAQWAYFKEYLDKYGYDYRNNPDILHYIADRMKEFPRFAPAFEVGQPATVPYKKNAAFRDEAADCAPAMKERAKALGMLNKKGIARRMAGKVGKGTTRAFGVAAAFFVASDVQAYGWGEGMLRNAPLTGWAYMGKDGVWYFGDLVVNGPGSWIGDYGGDIDDAGGFGGGPHVPITHVDFDDFFDDWNDQFAY